MYTRNARLVRPALQNLDFLFAPVMDGTSKLTMGEIVNGDAGKITVIGDNDTVIQGTSTSTATSGTSGTDGTSTATSGTGTYTGTGGLKILNDLDGIVARAKAAKEKEEAEKAA